MNDPLANLPGYVLRRASSAALAGLNRRLSALSLRHVDASLLMLLNGQPGITQSEAGRVLDIQRANMVPIVGRLEARGLIDRQRVDGRSQGLYLSAEGEALHTQVMGVIDAYEQTLMEGVPAPLRKQAMAVLHAFWQSAEAAIESD
ncbi:MarR family winged helix-turn-helix transcriptional regulator [Novosphingobium humi]|uniref:MarR family winged helix-turn-helix transcriptional regulator n=1 Tax=Novosphingobium humi TaxID=2282397 RepID=UPI0025AFCC37|nr:MarR family transcriptional regulator [Novosphingobium humi]WJS98652.1 MarR family transcriptional regulator [Novosphingobium humi]